MHSHIHRQAYMHVYSQWLNCAGGWLFACAIVHDSSCYPQMGTGTGSHGLLRLILGGDGGYQRWMAFSCARVVVYSHSRAQQSEGESREEEFGREGPIS